MTRTKQPARRVGPAIVVAPSRRSPLALPLPGTPEEEPDLLRDWFAGAKDAGEPGAALLGEAARLKERWRFVPADALDHAMKLFPAEYSWLSDWQKAHPLAARHAVTAAPETNLRLVPHKVWNDESFVRSALEQNVWVWHALWHNDFPAHTRHAKHARRLARLPEVIATGLAVNRIRMLGFMYSSGDAELRAQAVAEGESEEEEEESDSEAPAPKVARTHASSDSESSD